MKTLLLAGAIRLTSFTRVVSAMLSFIKFVCAAASSSVRLHSAKPSANISSMPGPHNENKLINVQGLRFTRALFIGVHRPALVQACWAQQIASAEHCGQY